MSEYENNAKLNCRAVCNAYKGKMKWNKKLSVSVCGVFCTLYIVHTAIYTDWNACFGIHNVKLRQTQRWNYSWKATCCWNYFPAFCCSSRLTVYGAHLHLNRLFFLFFFVFLLCFLFHFLSIRSLVVYIFIFFDDSFWSLLGSLSFTAFSFICINNDGTWNTYRVYRYIYINKRKLNRCFTAFASFGPHKVEVKKNKK